MRYRLLIGLCIAARALSSEAAERSGLLVEAARRGPSDAVAWLLAAGADPNGEGASGETALFAAAERGQLEAARLLLAHGADPNRIPRPNPPTGVFSMTPLMAAAAQGHTGLVELLLAHGADAGIQTGETALYPQGVTALFLATANGHADAIRLLARAGTSGERRWKYLVLAIWIALGAYIAIAGDADRRAGSTKNATRDSAA
ncbi:MAG: ankyrin repeat domain-containing protein [Candidatus Aureabacteria bacterium]|nr:ankyrin repeat domain-containing protein [Candidatus Auribacterota bacterium]